MCENLNNLAETLGTAAGIAETFPFDPELGWSEFMHNNKRASLSVLLLNLRQRAGVLALGQNAGVDEEIPRIDAGQLVEIQQLLDLAQSEDGAAPEKWAALENLMNQAQGMVY